MDFTTHTDVNFSEELLNLIKEGQTERVKEILLGSSLYLAADNSGATLLHYSVQYNNVYFTQYLLDKGCDVDVQDSMGNTPLMIAVTEKNISIIRILLAAGGDIFKLNNAKKSVLHILSTYTVERYQIIQTVFRILPKKCPTSEGIARKLVDAGCHLFQAIVLKDAKVIEYMLKAGSPVDFTDNNKFTAMHGAAILNDLRSIKVLVEHGADVNALDAKDENPLYKLYKGYRTHSSEKIEMLKILLTGGASMTSYTIHGVFQVFNILRKCNREVVRKLIESGLDLNIKDNHNESTVIHYCAFNRDPGVAEELKLHVDKFNVNARDEYGQTPLLLSAYKGNVSMLKFLLKHGARPDIKSVQHLTPLYYSYQRTKLGFEEQYRQCGEILLQYRADPQFVAIDENGETITIFDAALKNNDIKRIEPVVAHLAMIEKLGTPITETTWAKINSHDSVKEYFETCQKLLAEQIFERVTLHHVLISDKKKMARYLNNETIAQKLKDKIFKFEMSKCRYYKSILSRLFLKSNRYRRLKNRASGIIARGIFQNRVHKTHLIVDKIIDYLNDETLRQLYDIYLQLNCHINE